MRKMSNVEDVTNSSHDWEDFWHSPEKFGDWITYEQYQAAQQLIKDYEKQCNLKDQAHYNDRLKLDAEANSPYNDGWTQKALKEQIEQVRKEGGYDWTPGT